MCHLPRPAPCAWALATAMPRERARAPRPQARERPALDASCWKASATLPSSRRPSFSTDCAARGRGGKGACVRR